MIHKFIGSILRSRLMATAAIVCVALAAGCTTSRVPFKIGPNGEPLMFKRYERHAERDYVHHFTRHIYDHPGVYFKVSSPDQSEVSGEYGVPDWTRRFRSLTGERVTEWLYIEKAMVFQFIRGVLVYTGPITDLDQGFLQHGRPDYYDIFQSETNQSVSLIYTNLFPKKLEVYKYNKDQLIQKSEGN